MIDLLSKRAAEVVCKIRALTAGIHMRSGEGSRIVRRRGLWAGRRRLRQAATCCGMRFEPRARAAKWLNSQMAMSWHSHCFAGCDGNFDVPILSSNPIHSRRRSLDEYEDGNPRGSDR